MQTDPFDTMIRNLEGKLVVARDNLKLYEDKFKQWRDECNMLSRQVREAVEAKSFYNAGLPDMRGNVPPQPEPEEKDIPLPASIVEVKAKPATPFPAVANGLDRFAIKRQLRDWRIHYPLSVSHENPGYMIRQALIAELTNHPGYDELWLDKGHVPLTAATGGVNMEVLENAAKCLGLDYAALREKVRRLHSDVTVYGVKGIDYLWSPRP